MSSIGDRFDERLDFAEPQFVVAALQHAARHRPRSRYAEQFSDYYSRCRFYAPFDTAPKSGSAEV
jgi:hypothetical protein